MSVRYRIVIPAGVDAAIQLDDAECRRVAGLVDDDGLDAPTKRTRSGLVAYLTIDQLAKLASAAERSDGWDMTPQAIAGCNRFAKRVASFVSLIKQTGDLCAHCRARRELHAGNNYTGSAPLTGCRRFKPKVTL